MKYLWLCLVFVCQLSYAKSLSLINWIDFFSTQGVQIFHSSDYLSNHDKQVIFNLDPSSLADFNLALKSLSLMLVEIDNNTFVIKPNEVNLIPSTGVLIKLIDAHSNLNIKNFNILHIGENHSSENGVVLLKDVENDEIEIATAAKGYYSVQQSISVNHNHYKVVSILLFKKPVSIDQIVVTASKINFRSNASSNRTFDRKDLENTAILGNDPIRSSETIAGNTSTGISAKSRTRGGNENESLIVLDNHVLRNPFHFKNFYSLFSTINLSVVDNIDFYSGVFPMQFGGKLSSVMDIKTGDNINQNSHELGVDLLNTYYTYRHSNDNYSKQLQTSLRSGGHLINDHIIKDNIIRPEFDDAYIKYFQQINPYWQASQHLLLSRDDISIDDTESDDKGEIFGEQADASSHDQNLWLQWNYDNEENSSANIQVYAVRKHDSRIGFINNEESVANLSEDIKTQYFGLKYQQNQTFSQRFSINYGVEIYNEKTEIHSQRNTNHFGELVQQLGLQRQQEIPFDFENNGNAANLFVNGRYQYSDSLIFDLGFRIEYKQWIDNKIRSPRLNMSYFYDDKTTYRMALGRLQQSQHIDELLLEDNLPGYFSPTSADVAVFEINRELNQNFNLRAEIYFKKYSSTQPYYENIFNSLHVIPDLFFDRTRIAPDDSQSNGLEISLNGTLEDTQWSASYIFSDVHDEINGLEIPRSWDQHNALKLKLHVPIKLYKQSKWKLNLSFNYHNGWAKTDIIETDTELEISTRNSNQFKDFYQFDINLSKHQKTSKGDILYSFQVNNLLNTRNVCCINYQLQDDSLISNKKSWLPIAPNISFIYKW